MTYNKIRISTLVFADIDKVWEYYTSSAHIINWNFATDTWHCPTASNELRVGGKYKARMEAKDGPFGFDFEAVYNEISKNRKLDFTLTDGRRVIVDFVPDDTKTEVTITFDAEKENPEELQRSGWQAILNNFKHYTEEN